MSTFTDLTKEVIFTLTKISALEQRTSDILASQIRLEGKLDSYIERITKLEVLYETLKTSTKSEVIGTLRQDLFKEQLVLELQERNLKSLPK